jgi:hypothetical protein
MNRIPLVLPVLLSLLLLCSCAKRSLGPDPLMQQQIEQMTYEIAVQVYQAGEYGKAGALLEDLAGHAQDPLIKAKARFGSVASQLAGAATDEEYDRALAAWRSWSDEIGGNSPETDPRFLPPVMAVLERKARAERKPPVRAAAPVRSQAAAAADAQEMRKLRESIRERESENAALRERISRLERAATASSAAAAERLRWNETMKEREKENAALRERIAGLESKIASIGQAKPADDGRAHAEQIERMNRTVEEREQENRALLERLDALERELSDAKRQGRAVQAVPPKVTQSDIAKENQRLKEKLEALERLHQEMLERKWTVYSQ